LAFFIFVFFARFFSNKDFFARLGGFKERAWLVGQRGYEVMISLGLIKNMPNNRSFISRAEESKLRDETEPDSFL
jgi:predicted glycosyltransferase involved in capsule biosynthesis